MSPSGTSCLLPLAARPPWLAASARVARSSARTTSPRKTRVRGCPVRASGRSRGRALRGHGIATGWRVRPLKTVLGRSEWLSRDPIGERSGRNLYGFVRNIPLSLFDYLGLAEKECTEAIGKNGQPRIIFDPAPPKGGWKAVSFDFEKGGERSSAVGRQKDNGVKPGHWTIRADRTHGAWHW